MLYHLILVCKYRKKLLIVYGEATKRLFEEIAAKSDFSIVQMEGDQDHIHCLVKSEPRIAPLAIVRKWKQESTVHFWQSYGNDLKRHFWKERTFWSDGYFCCTIGHVSQETIRHSIGSQG